MNLVAPHVFATTDQLQVGQPDIPFVAVAEHQHVSVFNR